MNDTQDAEKGGCSTILTVLFFAVPIVVIGGSAYGLYLGTSRYLSGVPLASSEVLTPILLAVIFLGVLASFASRIRSTDSEEPPADAPWKARPAWQTNEIEETPLSTRWIITTIVWNLFTFPFAAFILYSVVWQAPTIGWGMYAFSAFILAFPAIGVGFVWSVVKDTLHKQKYGVSSLVMETMPGRLGEPLRAHVRTPLRVDRLPDEGIQVQVSCYRRKLRNGRGQMILQWQEDEYVGEQALSHGSDGLEVPVAFDLPADQPPSTPKETAKRILWEVDVTAAVSGLNYDVSFEIPVFPPDEDLS